MPELFYTFPFGNIQALSYGVVGTFLKKNRRRIKSPYLIGCRRKKPANGRLLFFPK